MRLYKKEILKYRRSQCSPFIALQQIDEKTGEGYGPLLFWIKNRGICVINMDKTKDDIVDKNEYFKSLNNSSQFDVMSDQETYALIMLRSMGARTGVVEYKD